MKIAIVIIITLVVGGSLVYLLARDGEDITNSSVSNSSVDNSKQTVSYTNMSPFELDSLLASREDVFLLDVHTPEQEHIAGTDSFIPYDTIEGNIAELPKDKNQKIVVYCRSGSMSVIASDKLIDLGYTNVINLEGGIKAWNSYQELN